MPVLRYFVIGSLAAVACAASAAQSTPAFQLPGGVRVDGSGFWTVEVAPASLAPARRPDGGAETELTFYAQLAGVSNAEAASRLKHQEAARPEFERLLRTLRTRERGNYTDAELIHRPDWAYLIYFKRAPAATLARYTKNPRFKARAAKFTEAELQRLTKPWLGRLSSQRLTTGWAMNPRQGRADIDMVVSEQEFAAIAAHNGWEQPPAYLNLRFGSAPVGPAVEQSVAPRIRIFPRSDRNLGATNQAALGGRIVLRNGCFLVVGHDGKEQLAYFAREVGLGIDDQGYLALHRRVSARPNLGRIGEWFTWAGPIGIDEAAPMVLELRAKCGKAPLMHVGIPESTAVFNLRYGLSRAPVTRPRRVKTGG